MDSMDMWQDMRMDVNVVYGHVYGRVHGRGSMCARACVFLNAHEPIKISILQCMAAVATACEMCHTALMGVELFDRMLAWLRGL